MEPFNLRRFPFVPAVEWYRKFKKRMIFHPVLEAMKLLVLIAVTVFILLEYFLPLAQSGLKIDRRDPDRQFFSFTKFTQDPSVKEVLNLANMIRLITNDQLSESKVLRYAGLICHASQKYGVNPLAIIAIITAESEFKETSVNSKSGDYGLGQINWEHWGKPNGLTSRELLDPSINIYLTCHVFKFFGQDFGRYHRGDGIKCDAYLVNVKSILSTLQAFVQLNKDNDS